jgi:hypothetical protein
VGWSTFIAIVVAPPPTVTPATIVTDFSSKFQMLVYCYKKGKVVPLSSIEAHLGDRRYSSYSFLTSALEGGEWSASYPGRALPPGKEPPVPTVQEVGWAPEPVWTQRLEEKSFASVVDRIPAVQSVVRRYTDWATRLTSLLLCFN